MSNSNDNPSIGMKEKGLHYAAMSLMIFMIILAVVVSYFAMQKPFSQAAVSAEQPVLETVGEKKPLPDFLIDNVEKDELELLKP
ncbi:MAG: hypothetical protein OEY94_07575 [Alphaproteobacteria bacterium]|nr:hypothetical protein [Alphaproteobacteria bacterium]